MWKVEWTHLLLKCSSHWDITFTFPRGRIWCHFFIVTRQHNTKQSKIMNKSWSSLQLKWQRKTRQGTNPFISVKSWFLLKIISTHGYVRNRLIPEDVRCSCHQRFNWYTAHWKPCFAPMVVRKGTMISFCSVGLQHQQACAFLTPPHFPFTPACLEWGNASSPGKVLMD